MKRFIFILGVLLAWTGCAAAENVTMTADQYKSIMRKMDAMQKQINAGGGAATQRRGGSARTRAVETKYDKLAQDVNGIYDTLDVVETRSLQDRINFGFELRERWNSYTVKNHMYWDGTAMQSIQEDTDSNNFDTRFRLNMAAQIRRGLEFHGRVTVFKNWNDNDWNTSTVADNNFSHRATDTQLKLERAYVDWVPDLPIPLAFTFGRLPVSEGPPNELKENRKRLSTYPSLLFDGETNGLLVTFGLERYLKIKNSGLRYFYAKAYQDDVDTINYLDGIGSNVAKDAVVSGFFFEGEVPKMRDSLFVLGYISATDLIDNPFKPVNNLGDLELFVSHIQLNNIFNSGVDWFFSYAGNHSHPNGAVSSLPISMAPPAMSQVSLLDDGTPEGHKGQAYYTGFRYTIPVKALEEPKIGFEYNKGSRYWFGFTPGSTEIFDKLGTRGAAYDVYYIQPFNDNLFMRVGHTIIKYDYTGSGRYAGLPRSTDAEFSNTYAFIEVRY